MSQVIGSNMEGTYGTFDWVKESSQTNTGVVSPKPFDWTKLGAIILPKVTQTPVICKDGTTDFSLSSPNAKYDNSKVCANNGGIAVTFRKVRCNDGTIQNQRSSQNAEYIDACINNGGTSKYQTLVKPTTNKVKQQNLKVGDVLTAEDKFYEKLGIKYHNTNMFGVASRIKGRFLVAVVLVAGYFAYKKFKK